MKIIPAKPASKKSAETFSVIPAPTALMSKALVVDGDYQEAAHPAIRRAEAAVKRVREQARNTIPDDIERLSDAFLDHEARPRDGELKRRLFQTTHDLRGTAASLDQQMIARIAQSMARLMTHCIAPSAVLLRAHVEALRAAEREGVRDAKHALASELAGELERRTQKAIDREKTIKH
jgi:chemotaxis protein histidine kinase CheA